MHKAFVRFGMVHIAASNLCVWAYTSILETAEDVRLTASSATPSPGHEIMTPTLTNDNMTIVSTPAVMLAGRIYTR